LYLFEGKITKNLLIYKKSHLIFCKPAKEQVVPLRVDYLLIT